MQSGCLELSGGTYDCPKAAALERAIQCAPRLVDHAAALHLPQAVAAVSVAPAYLVLDFEHVRGLDATGARTMGVVHRRVLVPFGVRKSCGETVCGRISASLELHFGKRMHAELWRLRVHVAFCWVSSPHTNRLALFWLSCLPAATWRSMALCW